MFKILNKTLPGKVAVKVHSGEKGNKNFLHPDFLRTMNGRLCPRNNS